MAEAAFWGLVSGSALVIGAVVGLHWRPEQHVLGIVMAFGAGVLISALTFELTQEAFDRAGLDAVAFGLAGGAVTFSIGNWKLGQMGGTHRKRSRGQMERGSAKAIAFGAVLDGIPESIVIGVTLSGGGKVSAPIVAAVFLSNVPESLASANGLMRAGFRSSYVIGMWATVTVLAAAAAAFGFEVVGDASPEAIAVVEAFAAGAILAMLADTMMPEAFEKAGPLTGLATVLGFALAFYLAQFE